MVRRLSGAFHSLRHHSDVGHRRDGGRNKALGRKGLPRHQLQRQSDKARFAQRPQQLWEPLWKVVTDLGTTLCLHIGLGNTSPHASLRIADRGVYRHDADGGRFWCRGLAQPVGAAPLSDDAGRAVEIGHRLDTLFDGARRLQPRTAPCLDPFRQVFPRVETQRGVPPPLQQLLYR